MRRRWTAAATLVSAAVLLSVTSACGLGLLGREYEYEEQVYLDPSGSATIVVDSSIPALVALRGLPIDPSALARVDREAIRTWLSAHGCQVTRIPEPWRRHGRRFLQIRLSVDDIKDLGRCALTSWSTYSGLVPLADGSVRYQQTLSNAAGADPGKVNWDGGEIVGFKLHLPSNILEHDAQVLAGGPKEPDRGNILTWEQKLVDRRAGVPIAMVVRIDQQSILAHTLTLFIGAFIAALAALATIVWMIRRKGKRREMAIGGR
jgi:hypothetical protein